jgi:predicted RNA binding protein YcfA (HicA-like mRNA interferase family)
MSDLRKIIKVARSQGWRVEQSPGSSHWMFYPPDKDNGLVTVSSSPSDRRAMINIKRDLRKAGLVLR